MRYPTIVAGLAGTLLVATMLTGPAVAQNPPTLVYVQPLSPQAVQAVQDGLSRAGVYAGRIDGIWGVDSQAALERYQQSHQLQVTGQLNQATAATLGLDPNSLGAIPAVAPTPALLPPDTLRSASVRAIQARLRSLGFYGGPVDGVWGEGTQVAVERLQQGRGLQPSGQLNPATISAMGLTPDVLAYR